MEELKVRGAWALVDLKLCELYNEILSQKNKGCQGVVMHVLSQHSELKDSLVCVVRFRAI